MVKWVKIFIHVVTSKFYRILFCRIFNLEIISYHVILVKLFNFLGV